MIRINFMGDVMLAELLETYRRGLTTFLKKTGIDPFEHVRPVLERADLNVINLECVLSGMSILERPFSEILISPEAFLGLFTRNRINVMNFANNHSLDHGRMAFDRTIDLLRGSGMTVFGYDKDSFFQETPAVVETGRLRLGFLGYNISNFPEPDRTRTVDRVISVVENARGSVDKLIVSMHWGEEYTNIPPPYVIRYGKRILAAGCDILHGHHSHRIQGVIREDDRIFAPSLGNFVFDQMVEKNRITAILGVEIDDSGSLELEYMPCYQNDSYQPEASLHYASYVEEINGYVAESWKDGNEDIYAALVDRMVSSGHRANRIRMRRKMLSHFWDYLPHLGGLIAFKRGSESMYSVIKDERSLADRSGKDSR